MKEENRKLTKEKSKLKKIKKNYKENFARCKRFLEILEKLFSEENSEKPEISWHKKFLPKLEKLENFQKVEAFGENKKKFSLIDNLSSAMEKTHQPAKLLGRFFQFLIYTNTFYQLSFANLHSRIAGQSRGKPGPFSRNFEITPENLTQRSYVYSLRADPAFQMGKDAEGKNPKPRTFEINYEGNKKDVTLKRRDLEKLGSKTLLSKIIEAVKARTVHMTFHYMYHSLEQAEKYFYHLYSLEYLKPPKPTQLQSQMKDYLHTLCIDPKDLKFIHKINKLIEPPQAGIHPQLLSSRNDRATKPAYTEQAFQPKSQIVDSVMGEDSVHDKNLRFTDKEKSYRVSTIEESNATNVGNSQQISETKTRADQYLKSTEHRKDLSKQKLFNNLHKRKDKKRTHRNQNDLRNNSSWRNNVNALDRLKTQKGIGAFPLEHLGSNNFGVHTDSPLQQRIRGGFGSNNFSDSYD